MIKLFAAVPIDDPRDEFPAANWTDIEVHSWDEWAMLLDYHGIIRWKVLINDTGEEMPAVLQSMLDDSDIIAAVNRLDGEMFHRRGRA